MDPEVRYGRAYVPRSTYSYITTVSQQRVTKTFDISVVFQTNLDRKSRSRGYSQPPSLDRDWNPSKTYWMPVSLVLSGFMCFYSGFCD